MSRAQVLDAAVAAVERARGLCDEVEFSAEDAMRTEPEYLAEVFSAVAAAGAGTLNAPDTVGYAIPSEVAGRFAWLRAHVKGAERVVFSCHCHDDLGMGVANSLAAVSAGARQVECTVNGIGERAGNAALEEVVMGLKVRANYFGATTRVDTRKLNPASRLLVELTGQPVQPNKAIVGRNAFAHESGIHQHGMLRHPSTYEIMRPQDVGVEATRLVLGKHSGRAALRKRLQALGHAPDEAALDDIFARFKVLADQRHEIHDRDLDLLARARVRRALREVAA
jgi:2-isopropylmalate synthase